MFKNRRFKFSLESTILACLAAAICWGLAYWQYSRYVGKLAYLEQVAEQDRKGTVSLPSDNQNWEDWHQAVSRVRGVFNADWDCVIINRSMGERPGVKLISPMQIEGRDEWILVDRGFIPYGHSEKQARSRYYNNEVVTVEGRLKPSQEAQFFISMPRPSGSGTKKVDRWHRLDIDAMAQQIPVKLLPIYLEQTNQEGEFPAFLERAVVPPWRHMNYTIQWISFGTFGLFLGLILQFRRSHPQTQP